MRNVPLEILAIIENALWMDGRASNITRDGDSNDGEILFTFDDGVEYVIRSTDIKENGA